MFPFRKKKTHTFTRKKVQTKRLSHLQYQMIIGVVISIVIALLITAIWYGTRIQSLQIEQVSVIGGQTIPHPIIKEKAETILNGTYLSLIPKRFMLLYPKNTIVENIRTLNRVKNIDLQISDDQTLVIIFDEYIPYALWCGESESEAPCFFIDGTGYAFAVAPDLEGSAFVRYTEDGLLPQAGAVSFEKKFIEETETFIDLLKEHLSLYVTNVKRIGNYDVEFKLAGGGVIKVSQDIPMAESFENLETILTSEEFSHLTPGSFQYIDLRFGEKIFVNEEIPPAAPATTSTSSTIIEN